MKFWDHQQNARSETRRLLLAFALAVAVLVLAGWWVETSNLRAGGVKLAQRVGARELRASLSHAEQRLANVVDELCIAAHMQHRRHQRLCRRLGRSGRRGG